MILKIVSLFLIAMVVLAIFGRLKVRLPGGRKIEKCRKCGRYIIGKGPCSCRAGKNG